ncbi:MAG: PspC domain-containing protein [Pseudoxanthomonas sp.]|nr:PspC domain-containing protein [Pseudoxanthomonas sp.]
MEWDFRNLARSTDDAVLAGICSGLGAHTPVPTWLWRAAMVVLAFAGGTGLVAYVALWVFMPSPQPAGR